MEVVGAHEVEVGTAFVRRLVLVAVVVSYPKHLELIVQVVRLFNLSLKWVSGCKVLVFGDKVVSRILVRLDWLLSSKVKHWLLLRHTRLCKRWQVIWVNHRNRGWLGKHLLLLLPPSSHFFEVSVFDLGLTGFKQILELVVASVLVRLTLSKPVWNLLSRCKRI